MSILDQSTLSEGFTAAEVIANTVALVREVDRLGYHRIWLSEHHNMSILQESAPEVVLASVGTQTQRIRIGSGGVMLRNHSAYHVAEVFRMLVNIKNERRAIHSLKRSPFAPTTKAGRPC
jgi:luciferase family oxidoreductase group 1